MVGTHPLGYMPTLGFERFSNPELAVTNVRHRDPKLVGLPFVEQ